MGNYAVFCSNDKFLICTLLRIGHNSSCASYVVCILGYCSGTFRMDKKLRIWMCFLCFCHICFAHSKMSWATTLDKFKSFLRNLFCYPCSEVTVRNKKNLVVLQLLNNRYCWCRCNTYVTQCLQFRSCINISYYCIIRILFF